MTVRFVTSFPPPATQGLPWRTVGGDFLFQNLSGQQDLQLWSLFNNDLSGVTSQFTESIAYKVIWTVNTIVSQANLDRLASFTSRPLRYKFGNITCRQKNFVVDYAK